MSSNHDREIAAMLHRQNGRAPICSFDKDGYLLSLNIADCNLVQIPPEIGELQYLRKLVVSNNPLRTLQLPAALTTHTELFMLSANGCKLEVFPTCLPPHLKKFSADYNQIRSLTGIPEQSPLLEEISLYGNRLENFPNELLMFKNLRELDLGKNLLTTVSPTIQHLHALQKLNLTANSLDTLPTEIEALSELQALYLGDNTFNQLPDVLFALGSLQILKLDGNRLQTIPEKIGLLGNLHTLSLARNNLRSLPLALQHLHHLQILDVHNNELDTIPAKIQLLNSLETMNLDGNPVARKPLQTGGA